MNGYVYIKQVSSAEELRNLLEKLKNEETYYFLRSPHAVSGITMNLPAEFFPSLEGQMFNSQQELRWKKQGDRYEILLLSQQEVDLSLGFQPLSNNWETCDRQAYLYDVDETRYPKGFSYKGENDENLKAKDINVGQRYFKDANTQTVHFVALTIKEK